MKKAFVIFISTLLLFIFTSCPSDNGILVKGALEDKVIIEGTKGIEITESHLVVKLDSGAFVAMAKGETQVSSWFSPFPMGLSIDLLSSVKEGDSSLTLVFTGKPISANTNSFLLRIPFQYFVNPKKGMTYIDIDTKGSQYKIIQKTIASLDQGIKVVGSTDTELVMSDNFVLRVDADSFKSDISPDVTSWFTPKVDGVKYEIVNRFGDTAIEIKASGTPSKPLDQTSLVITIHILQP